MRRNRDSSTGGDDRREGYLEGLVSLVKAWGKSVGRPYLSWSDDWSDDPRISFPKEVII